MNVKLTKEQLELILSICFLIVNNAPDTLERIEALDPEGDRVERLAAEMQEQLFLHT